MGAPRNTSSCDDEQTLVHSIAQGDAGAMRLLYDRYMPQLASVCTRYIADDSEAKDVLQDSFVSIFTSIGGFSYKGEGSLRAWMTRIVINRAINSLKKSMRFSQIETTGRVPDVPDDDGDGAVLADRVPIDVIHGFIRQLPDGYRTVFNMSVIEHRSHSEIAAALGIKKETSASQLHRAKAVLARQIKDYVNTHDC